MKRWRDPSRDPSDKTFIGEVYKGSGNCELHSDSKSIENELLAQDRTEFVVAMTGEAS